MSTEELYKIFLKAENGVTTDTRNCGDGMMFFALRGENFNGNQFAHKAINSGCIAAIVDDINVEKAEGIIIVDNVLESLQNLARHYRRSFIGMPVLALTGSNGKTTTKELTTAVLSKKFKVHATKGNLNNHIGVPLTLLSAPKDCQFLVVEMGANHIGEIATLARIAEPNYGLITNIGLAHLEGFGGEDGVKKGKKELFDYLSKIDGSKVFVNEGHEKLMEVSSGLDRIIYGTNENKPVVRFEMERGRMFVWAEEGYESPRKGVQLEGDYNLDNIVAAITIGRYFSVEREKISAAISDYVPSNNRSQLVKTEMNSILLDAYNANPSSMCESIKSFVNNYDGDKLVILGEMRELGDFSIDSHAAIVKLCDELGVDGIFVGVEFNKVAKSLTVNGRFYEEIEDLFVELENKKVVGKNILLKGSRGMAMERLLEHL